MQDGDVVQQEFSRGTGPDIESIGGDLDHANHAPWLFSGAVHHSCWGNRL